MNQYDKKLLNTVALLFAAVFALVLTVVSVHCQEIPDAPSPAIAKKTIDKKFIALSLAHWTSAGADFLTTRNGRNAGLTETNPIFGERPSDAKILSILVPVSFAQNYLSYYAKKKCEKGDGKRWCVLWPMPVSVSIAVHGIAAKHNYYLLQNQRFR